MKLTLKLHQIVQAIDFIANEDSSVDDLDVEISFKQLADGIYIWRADAPENSLKLEAEIPKLLMSKLEFPETQQESNFEHPIPS